MRHHRLEALVLLLLVLGSGFVLGEDVVALVTDLDGNVTRVDGRQTRSISLLDELPKGARLQVAAGGRIALVYMDSGEEFTIHGPAGAVLAAEGAQNEDGPPPQTRRLLVELYNWCQEECRRLQVEQREHRFTRRMIREALGWGGRLADLLHGLNEDAEISMGISLAGTNDFQAGASTRDTRITSSSTASSRATTWCA